MTTSAMSSFSDLMVTVAGIQPGSPREVRARRIVAAATALFLEHGFHKTSVRMVADAAGVSMGNLYQYIRQKEDLLYLTASVVDEDCRAHLSAVPIAGSVRERIVRLFHELINVGDRHQNELRMLAREVAYLPQEMISGLQGMQRWVTASFEAFLREGVEKGEIERCDMHILAVNIKVIALEWYNRPHEISSYVDIEAFRREQTRNILRMIPFKSDNS